VRKTAEALQTVLTIMLLSINVALADIDINIDLIKKFLKGLSDKGIGRQASTYNPDMYAAALEDAQQASKIVHGWDLPSAFCHTGGEPFDPYRLLRRPSVL
jgi:hypothetical protein